jgi:hypothetical protein
MGLVNLAVGLRKISKKRGIGGNKFTRDGNVFYNLGTKTTNPWPEPSQNAEKTASAGNLVFLVRHLHLPVFISLKVELANQSGSHGVEPVEGDRLVPTCGACPVKPATEDRVLYWFLFCWYGRRRKEDE